MGKARNCILAAVGLTITVGSLSALVARPSRSAGGAVPVQVTGTTVTSDTDNFARQPFQFSSSFPLVSQSFIKTFTVPSGKRLVITGISLQLNFVGATDTPEVAVNNTAGGTGASHIAGLPKLQDSGSGKADFVMPLTPVVICADPGTSVSIQVAGLSAAGAASGSAYGSVTGYYVNLP